MQQGIDHLPLQRWRSLGNLRPKFLGDSKQQKLFGCSIWTVKQKEKKVLVSFYMLETKMYGRLHVSGSLTEIKRVCFMYFETAASPKQDKWAN